MEIQSLRFSPEYLLLPVITIKFGTMSNVFFYKWAHYTKPDLYQIMAIYGFHDFTWYSEVFYLTSAHYV